MTMKNYLYGILAIALLAFTACTKEELSAPEPAPAPDVPAEYRSGEVLVKFAPYVSDILDREGHHPQRRPRDPFGHSLRR